MMKQKNAFSIIAMAIVLLFWATNTACDKKRNDQYVESLYTIGKQWRIKQQLDSAIHYFSKAEEAITTTTNPTLKAKIYANIADMLSFNKCYNLAIDYFYKSLDCYHETGNHDMEAHILMDIGKTYQMTDENIDVIRPYYEQALAISPNDTIKGKIIQQIGLCFYFYNMHDSARYYLQKSLDYPFFDEGMSITYLFLGNSFYDTQQLDSAEHYLQQALNSEPGFRQRTGCYTMLHHVAEKRNDSSVIARYASLHAQYTDSIGTVDAKLSQELHDIQSAKNELLILQKDRRNRWLAVLAVLTCVVAVACWLAILAYRRRKAQAQQAAEQAKQAIEQAQVATAQAQALEKTLEKERQNQETYKQLREALMRKYETEEGRALERKRREYENKLANALQKAERHPRMSAKYKACVHKACNDLLHWDDNRRFSTLLNNEFNGFACKIEARYFQRHSANQATIRLCCLLWFNVPEQYIATVMNYAPSDYRQAIERACQRFGVNTSDEFITTLYGFALGTSN